MTDLRPLLDGERATEHDDTRDQIADAIRQAAYTCPGDTCQLTEAECCGQHPITWIATSRQGRPDELVLVDGTTTGIADAAMTVVAPRLEQLHDAWAAAERAGVAAVALNEQLRTELRRTANRLDHIPVPETAPDAQRLVRSAAAYLRTLAGLSAVAVASRAALERGPVTEIPVQTADIAVVLGLLERLDATGDEYTAAALERLGRAVRVAEGEEEPVPS